MRVMIIGVRIEEEQEEDRRQKNRRGEKRKRNRGKKVRTYTEQFKVMLWNCGG